MALLHYDGFDNQDSDKVYSLLSGTTTGSLSYADTTAFGVGSCLTLTTASNAGVSKGFAAAAQVFVGARVRVPSVNSNQNFLVFLGDNGATTHIQVRRTANDSVSVYRSGTLLAASASGVLDGNWHYIEVTVTVADTGGIVQVRVDGTQVINFSGDTKNAGTNSTIDTVTLNAYSGAQLIVDDLVILDATGTAPYNTFLGDTRVQTLVPSGAGTTTQLTPSTGANWDCVNEVPYSATDYVSGSTVGNKDTYATTDLGAGYSILAVKTKAIAKKTDAGVRNLKTVVRSGGTDYSDITASPLSGTDQAVSNIRTADPATGAAWTTAGVNAMEIGVEVA